MSNALNKWTEKLLDLSKRNKLINFKSSRLASMPAVFPDLDTVFNKIIGNKALEVFDIDSYLTKNYKSKGLDFPNVENIGILEDPELTKLKKIIKASQVLLYKNGINALEVIENISKKSKDSITETGINSLFLAFGFVQWFEPKAPEINFWAPLILVPITLKNESLLDPFAIKLYEDEIITNPTLIYKLKSEFNIDLPEMDEDDKLSGYLNKIRMLFEPLSWKVADRIEIGMFSFLKMNMYIDLKNNESKLLSNKITRSLIYDYAEDKNPDDKEAESKDSELHNVVDADSSQTQAIKLSKSKENFVLQGPPGTGKSQTITNIIAECLFDNKKVLFVSEKLAALNVVYNNLKNAGLADFCLELHSHKTNKKDIVTELNRVLKKPKVNISEKADQELDVLKKTQAELNNYVFELHKKNAVINMSAYELYGESAKLENAENIDFNILNIEEKGESHLLIITELLGKYLDYTLSIGCDYRKNEWYGYVNYGMSYNYKTVIAEKLNEVLKPLKNLFITKNLIENKFGLKIANLKQFNDLIPFLNFIKNFNDYAPNLYNKDNLAIMLKSFNSANILSTEINKILKELNAVFNDKIYEYDFKEIYDNFLKTHGKFFNKLKKTYISDISLLENNKLNINYKLNFKKSLKFLEKLVRLKFLKDEFLKIEDFVVNCLEEKYEGFNTQWSAYLEQLKILENSSKSGLDFTPLSTIGSLSFDELADNAEILIKRIQNESGAFNQSVKLLKNYFDESLYNFSNSDISESVLKLEKCIQNIDNLENWTRFNKLLNEMEKADIKRFVDYLIDKNFVNEKFINAYKKIFFKQWIHNVLSSNSVLLEFNRIAQDRNINLFAEKDKLQFEISKAQINAKLSNLRPSLDIIPNGSQVSILLKEEEKKRKLMPVRMLLSKTAEITLNLKPCFLMSPLSVSTFLDSNLKFDVVIFDEASQIFPEDALGSIYRSKQVIVVGDSKQMPPTNFFNVVVNDADYEYEEETEDYVEDVKDYESILDICSTRFRQNRLKWHYRSRSEDLIAFSNKSFYNYELVTFPSAKNRTNDFGVEFYYLKNGVFDRRTKTNIVEAEYIANMVFEQLKKFPDRSLGVVAFSQSQQELIEKIILKLRKKDTTFERSFKDDIKEPFFIKNLETVQGDERDTIILGIGYAKDSADRFIQNFGPLNRQGGERRLNVAITRAKQNIKVISSINHMDIDLNRSKAVGTLLLKEYLKYADTGFIAPDENASHYEKSVFGFENEVYNFLIESGFDVDKQVGRSGYQIDLAIKDRKTKDYVLAVECDGPIYRYQKSTRDRDRLRKEVLNRLGWNFYRIWSTDWIKNNGVEKQKLIEYINTLLTEKPKKEVPKEKTDSSEFVVKATKEQVFPEYVFADIAKLRRETKANINNKANFQSFIRQIVLIESPISEEWLLKRIAFMFNGHENVTAAVKLEYKNLMAGITGIKRKNGFLYDSTQNTFNLRIVNEGGEQRGIKYIPIEELENGFLTIIKQNIKLEIESLYKALAKCLKLSRLGSTITERFETALVGLKDRGMIEISKGLVYIKR